MKSRNLTAPIDAGQVRNPIRVLSAAILGLGIVGSIHDPAVASGAASADQCNAFVGQKPDILSFDAIAKSLPKDLGPKGEYETTDQYEARLSATSAKAADTLVMDRPVNRQTFPDPLRYDADGGVLLIRSSAFDWGTTNWSIRLILAGHRHLSATLDSWNVATVISRPDRVTGSYEASNAFGMSKTVHKVTRSNDSIFIRAGTRDDHAMFSAGEDLVLGSVPMTPEVAKVAKSRIRFALVVKPKWPFLISGSDQLGAPTLSDPRKVTENYRIMFADVSCGLVLDGGEVLAAFPAA